MPETSIGRPTAFFIQRFPRLDLSELGCKQHMATPNPQQRRTEAAFTTSPAKRDAMVADHLSSITIRGSESTDQNPKPHDPHALGKHGSAALAKHMDAVREKKRRIEAHKSAG